MKFIGAFIDPEEENRRFVFCFSGQYSRAHVVVKLFAHHGTDTCKVWKGPFRGPDAHHWHTNIPFDPAPDDVAAAFRVYLRTRQMMLDDFRLDRHGLDYSDLLEADIDG